METILDRTYQLELLKKMAGVYPKGIESRVLVSGTNESDKRKLIANLFYLHEQGVITGEIAKDLNGDIAIALPRMTYKGMDFLEADGGLSAILDIVTIRFETKQLQEIIEVSVNNHSTLPPEDKSRMSVAIRTLPAESIKHLTMKLLDVGVAHVPDVMQLVQRCLLSPS